MTLPPTTLNRIVWAVRIFVALVFITAGVSKLAGVAQMVEIFEHIGIGQWFRYLTGIVEISGVALLLLPASGFLAALLLGATMICAVITHVFVIGGSPVPAIVLGCLSGFVAFQLRRANTSDATSKTARA
jgi:hypothetical protein